MKCTMEILKLSESTITFPLVAADKLFLSRWKHKVEAPSDIIKWKHQVEASSGSIKWKHQVRAPGESTK